MFFTRVPVNCLKKYGQVNRSACLESGRKTGDEKEPMQLSIFDIEIPKPLDEKHQKLKDAMEKLDARFGKGTVIKASLMKKRTGYKRERRKEKINETKL